jgi:hypothetical protein
MSFEPSPGVTVCGLTNRLLKQDAAIDQWSEVGRAWPQLGICATIRRPSLWQAHQKTR